MNHEQQWVCEYDRVSKSLSSSILPCSLFCLHLSLNLMCNDLWFNRAKSVFPGSTCTGTALTLGNKRMHRNDLQKHSRGHTYRGRQDRAAWCQFPLWRQLEPDITSLTLARIRETEVRMPNVHMQKQAESGRIQGQSILTYPSCCKITSAGSTFTNIVSKLRKNEWIIPPPPKKSKNLRKVNHVTLYSCLPLCL